jgi:peroxiredoxin
MKFDMRKLLFFVLALPLVWFGCDTNKEPSFTINAEITGPEESTLITMNKIVDGKLEVLDSAFLTKSKVTFSGSLDQPEMIYFRVGDTRQIINVFCENSNIAVNVNVDSLDKAIVKGSSIHDELMEFIAYMEPVGERQAELGEQYQEAAASSNMEKMRDIVDQYEALRLEQIERIKKFVASKPISYISPYIIKMYLFNDLEVEELERMLTGLDTSIHDALEYAELSKHLSTLKSLAIGEPAIDFALNDTTGNPIAISSFKGKFLLIDFWASWCAPCRKENPNVVRLYNDYSDKGFEIIGVSFDEDRGRWIQAIHDDGLTWPHVSDLKGFNSAAAQLYAIHAIPATFLLDREGNIVAKGLRGAALREKLEELYDAEG